MYIGKNICSPLIEPLKRGYNTFSDLGLSDFIYKKGYFDIGSRPYVLYRTICCEVAHTTYICSLELT